MCTVTVKVELTDLVMELARNDNEDLLSFVKELDFSVEDFQFTEKCAEYFLETLAKDYEEWENTLKMINRINTNRCTNTD